MMDVSLNAWLLFDHAPRHFADTEVVTWSSDGPAHRYTYREFGARTQQLMHALDELGLARGDRVATLAWNGFQHLEAYFAIPCTERVLHTLNLRLSAEDLAYIIGHADDRAILVDPDLLPLLEQIHRLGGLDRVRHIVVLGSSLPGSSLPGLVAYEELIASQPTVYPPRDIDEHSTLGLCYTSGTTGRPKGVAYTHRSTFLHALAASSRAGLSVGPGDCTLPVVPMFHANAWGLPYAATLVGAKQVFLHGPVDPGRLVAALAEERVTVTAGVPTVFTAAAEAIAEHGALPDLRHIVIGGSQPPRSLIERYRRELGLTVLQAWGMTETSPLGCVAWPQERMRDWSEERLLDVVRTQAGLPVPGVQLSIRDDDGRELPWDGESMGRLLVRGPWVAGSYEGGHGAESFTPDGWFVTGDMAIGSPDGYMVIADREKDLVKSGGEWISSVDMEDAITSVPGVVEAAVIPVPDPKWQERPLACVVGDVTLEQIRDHLAASGFARWQLPERLELLDALPRTTVGKLDKKALRARFPA